jgi:ABC-type transport system substrate-binding protein
MQNNYWSKVTKSRMSRRRSLALAGGSAAAVFLAACGSEDDGSGGSTTGDTSGDGNSAASGLVAQPIDTFEKAARGGILKDYVNAESQTLDPVSPVAPLNQVIKYTYGSLMTEEPGHLTTSPGDLRGDAAESWEISPDKPTITMKLRPGMKFHNKPPVNGREIDVDDVLFSWERYAKLSPFNQQSSNAANPEAPILSVSASDSNTIVVKLKEPLSYALKYFGIYGSQSGNLMLMPREAEGGFDPRHEIIGHGPFQLSEVAPSVGYKFTRNPDYYDKDWALVDQVEAPIVPEYAARLSQFKAGNMHRLYGDRDPASEDVIGIKRDEQDINLYKTEMYVVPWILIFGALPGSPFLDQRVRQAVSMGVDRDAWIGAIFNLTGFEADGLPVESRWNSHLLAVWQDPPYWLDPQGSDFGPNARLFQYNPEEAKKLLEAAGHGDGLKVTSSYPIERLPLQTYAEPIDGMLRNLDIDITVNTPDYATVYIPQYRDGNGQFEGWAYGSVTGNMPQAISPASALAAEYWPKGGAAFRGFSAGTAGDKSGDPKLTAMIEDARREFDEGVLVTKVHEIQRYLAEQMWGLSMPGGATGFDAAWPALQNMDVWGLQQGVAANWDAYRLWLDQTKRPFVK